MQAKKAISGGRVTETALYTSEDIFRVLAEMSSAVVVIYQGKNLVYVNEAAERLTGFSKRELLRRKFWDIAHPDFRELARERGLARLRGEPVPSHYEVKFLTKSGETRWADVTAGLIELSGKPAGIATLIDITERKNAEQALRESEERLQLCVATACLGSYDSDVVNDRHVWSPETYEIYGIPRDTVITLDYITSLIVPEDRRDSQYFAELDPAKTHGEFCMEYRIRRPSDGAIRWVNTRTRVFFSGEGSERKAVRVLGVVQDVTERKQAENKLRLTQFAVDSFTDSSLWQDSDGRIIYANEIACKNLGFTRDELLRMRIWDIDPNCSYDKFHERWEVLKKGGSIKFESVHIKKDGSAYPVEVSANYVDFEGRVYEVTFDRDIAERKAREKDLSDMKAQAELYLDLMGHDINNMNQVALGYLELAGDAIRSGGKLGEDKLELIEKPIASLNNSSGLIEKVMKLKKLKAREPEHYRVDISGVLARIKDRYSHLAGRDITINYAPHAECMVMADELLEEIFLNLVDNSIKHSRKDMPLAVDIIQGIVREGTGKCVRVSVEDNGPGISDEVKEKLFTRFSRGETKARGKGLGLYLVKTLVENFNGTIWAEDRVPGDHSKGAKFVVTLPVVDRQLWERNESGIKPE